MPRRKIDQEVLVGFLNEGRTVGEIAVQCGVVPSAVTHRIERLPPRILARLVSKGLGKLSVEVVDANRGGMDVTRAIDAAGTALRDVRQRIRTASDRELRLKDRLRLELMTIDRQTRLVDTILTAKGHMLRWAGFEQWQVQLMAVLEEASPELRNAFLARLAVKGYCPLLPTSDEQTPAQGGSVR